jgi:beta-glucuronidase
MRSLLLSLTFAALTAAAQTPAPLIANIEGRTTIDLGGQWHAIVDPYDTGFYDYRGQPRRDSFFLNAKPRSKADLIEYDFERSPTLNVPGDWNSQRDSLLFYEGTVWYQRSFTFHPAPGRRVFLYVGAANYESHLGVNGERVCSHIGGFTPFNCEITKLLRDGDNFVVISVNNRRHREAVPTIFTDWWNYGGITREVMLIEEPETFIRDYSLQLVKGSRDRLSGWVQLDGVSAAQTAVSVAIPELKLAKNFTTDKNGLVQVNIAAPSLQLWSPESPKLYNVEVTTGVEKVRDQLGFRTIETRGADILLNGEPIFLRGVNVHEEAATHPGRAWSEADDRVLLSWVQELGANFVRLAHYPHNEHMVRLADRLGILVWAEIPVYWTIDFTNPKTLANAQQQLREMITRDHNRAAVILWSVGNETPVSPERTEFLRHLVSIARQLDPTRLVTAALEARNQGASGKLISDPLGADVDVLGCNEYIGWYERTPAAAEEITWATTYDKPLIISEFGAEAPAGRHGDASDRWTEEYQADVYAHQLAMLSRIPNLRGMAPWLLKDFRSPRRLHPDLQDYFNRKGLVSDTGEKKKAFFVLKRAYERSRGSPRLRP